MFMVKNTQNEYLNAEPRRFTNVPNVVARFVNETSLRGYLRDNFPTLQTGTRLDMVDMDTGKVTEVVL